MKHRQRPIDVNNLTKKWYGSRVVLDWNNVLEEIDNKIVINVVKCDKCGHLCGGFKYKFMNHNMYGAMTFFDLRYVCVGCGNEMQFSRAEIDRINKYSSDNIDLVQFPGNVRTVIKNEAGVLDIGSK